MSEEKWCRINFLFGRFLKSLGSYHYYDRRSNVIRDHECQGIQLYAPLPLEYFFLLGTCLMGPFIPFLSRILFLTRHCNSEQVLSPCKTGYSRVLIGLSSAHGESTLLRDTKLQFRIMQSGVSLFLLALQRFLSNYDRKRTGFVYSNYKITKKEREPSRP